MSRKPAALDDGSSGKVEVLERVDIAAAVGCMPGHQQRASPAWITADMTATLLDIMVCRLNPSFSRALNFLQLTPCITGHTAPAFGMCYRSSL